MTEFRTREGQITAADTETQLTGLYGVSTQDAVNVPSNTSRISGMITSFATDSAANAATAFAIKLSNDGLKQSSQIITVGGAGVDGTPASNGATQAPVMTPLNLIVEPGNQISIGAFMSGDTGTVEASCTLIFE